MKMGIALAALATALASLPCASLGEVQSRVIDYRQGDTTLQGFLAWDDAARGPRPGVLVVHEWWGENQHARNQALRLAQAGYVGFALDMYGKGKVATHPRDAQAYMDEVAKDATLMKARFDAARALLKAQPEVDPTRIAAIGYCFGGTVALSMARAGEPLLGVGTFHAGLKPGDGAAEKGRIKARILVQTGGADSFVPKEQVQAFEKEMAEAGANARVITYEGAKHSFTNPDAAAAGVDGLAYDADADRTSWAALRVFLKEVFGS